MGAYGYYQNAEARTDLESSRPGKWEVATFEYTTWEVASFEKTFGKVPNIKKY